MAWTHVVDDSKKDNSIQWAHVEEEKKSDISELCESIDKCYSQMKDELDFGSFYSYFQKDQESAQILYALTEMQKCMGELSASVSSCVFKGDIFYIHDVELAMGRMLFFMEVMLQSHDSDLTEAADECKRLCRDVPKLI